jgi:hypothetical protein
MKYKELIKSIKGVFKPPVKHVYCGKVKNGCPYFYPYNYVASIIAIRLFKLLPNKNKAENLKYFRQYSRAWKMWKFILFNRVFVIEIGTPIVYKETHLGWKDKFDTPRFEWYPAKQLYFFGCEYSVFYKAPKVNSAYDSDNYYEMILWYLKYSDKDIIKAEHTWGWSNEHGVSTWNKKYLL